MVLSSQDVEGAALQVVNTDVPYLSNGPETIVSECSLIDQCDGCFPQPIVATSFASLLLLRHKDHLPAKSGMPRRHIECLLPLLERESLGVHKLLRFGEQPAL